MKLRVLFLGNHTVGVRALEALHAHAELVGVVAHPPDPEDGVAYASVGAWAERRGLACLRAKGRDAALLEFVRARAPELLYVADYRYLLPLEVVAAAPLGAVNLHPSLLPAYRGRAPINWAILNGEEELGLTAHVVDAGTDTGDVLAQARYRLGRDQDVGDALAQLYPLYESLTRDVIHAFERGTLVRTPQDHARATIFPRRTPADGAIDWRWTAPRVHDFVRALARPYPGAFTDVAGLRVFAWKSRVVDGASSDAAGTLLAADEHGLVFASARGSLCVREWSCALPREQALALLATQVGRRARALELSA